MVGVGNHASMIANPDQRLMRPPTQTRVVFCVHSLTHSLQQSFDGHCGAAVVVTAICEQALLRYCSPVNGSDPTGAANDASACLSNSSHFHRSTLTAQASTHSRELHVIYCLSCSVLRTTRTAATAAALLRTKCSSRRRRRGGEME